MLGIRTSDPKITASTPVICHTDFDDQKRLQDMERKSFDLNKAFAELDIRLVKKRGDRLSD